MQLCLIPPCWVQTALDSALGDPKRQNRERALDSFDSRMPVGYFAISSWVLLHGLLVWSAAFGMDVFQCERARAHDAGLPAVGRAAATQARYRFEETEVDNSVFTCLPSLVMNEARSLLGYLLLSGLLIVFPLVSQTPPLVYTDGVEASGFQVRADQGNLAFVYRVKFESDSAQVPSLAPESGKVSSAYFNQAMAGRFNLAAPGSNSRRTRSTRVSGRTSSAAGGWTWLMSDSSNMDASQGLTDALFQDSWVGVRLAWKRGHF